MYDLDKTQEWLNRTIQLSKAPPVRGGVSSEPHARRDTVLSVGAAALVIILGMLLISWKRSGGEHIPISNVVEADSGARSAVATAPPQQPHTTMGPIHNSNTIHRPNSAANPPAAIWSRSSLDGNVVPLPGHTAPPAPVWLDGAPRASH